MTPSMRDATELYETAASLELARVCVDHDELWTFSRAVSDLKNRLGEEAADSYWSPVLARLRRVRWELATVPLPFDHPAFELQDSAAFVKGRLRDCNRVFPAHAAAAHEISTLLTDLGSRADPLGAAVRSLPLDGQSAFLLLLDRRHAAAVAKELADPAGLGVVTPPELAGLHVHDAAAVIGPACWFPRQVFGAPRARRIHVLQFRWLSDDPLDPRIFAGGRMTVAGEGSSLPGYSGRAAQGVGLDSADLLPITDWAAIASGTGASTSEVEDRPDTVEAYLLLLASEQAVYLEAEEGSRAYVVKLGSSREFHMVSTRDIDPSAYLVSRVGGEGDYIPAIANSLLGEEAARLRGAQHRWKENLRELIDNAGIQDVLARLAAAGSSRSTRANLRRWASPSSIRTEDYADFAALMEVSGLGAEAQELWRDMDLIDQAHLRAGQRVRRLLVREILNGDTRELEVRGWQDYDVEEIEGEGALRVARVEARNPELLRVPSRQTRQLFSVERDLWQG